MRLLEQFVCRVLLTKMEYVTFIFTAHSVELYVLSLCSLRSHIAYIMADNLFLG